MMEEHPPLVSILMTAYNRQQFIAEAIESVLTTPYENWELIIVDDASKDKTVPIASVYRKQDNRINVYVNEKNLGDYPNRNKAASYAKGKYLVNVDSDDTMFAENLGRWVEEMESQNAEFGIFAKMGNKEPVLLTPAAAIKKHFFEKPILAFGPGATIVKKAYFDRMKGFPERYGPANDMYHHLKLAASSDTLIFPFPLINYRLHESQELNNKYGYLFNNYNYLKDALKELPLPLTEAEIKFLEKKNKRRFLFNIVEYFLKTFNFKKTKEAWKKAGFSFNDSIVAIFHL